MEPLRDGSIFYFVNYLKYYSGYSGVGSGVGAGSGSSSSCSGGIGGSGQNPSLIVLVGV